MAEEQAPPSTVEAESSDFRKRTVSKAILLVVAMVIIGAALVVVLWLLLTLTLSLVGSL